VGGPLCDTDDAYHDLEGELKGQPELPRYRYLPRETSPNDIIGVFHVGAYSIEESSNYNSLPRPPMILIGESGEDRVIRKGEEMMDLIKKEV
jgi:diaminopimelate decarboxylase